MKKLAIEPSNSVLTPADDADIIQSTYYRQAETTMGAEKHTNLLPIQYMDAKQSHVQCAADVWAARAV